MNPGDFSIATVTLVRAAEEEVLLRGALGELSGLGRPIALADGGSPESFCAFLSALPRVHLVKPRTPGLVGQVAASLQAASAGGAPFALYTESDKHLFFRDHARTFAARAPSGPKVGIVVASRSARSVATFPPLQQRTEDTINQFTGDAVGVAGDYSYGPFFLSRSLVPYLDRVPTDLGWGWRHFIFALASRLGYSVEMVEGDYPCPEEQRAEDEGERLHRLKQLAQNVEGLVLGLTTGTGR